MDKNLIDFLDKVGKFCTLILVMLAWCVFAAWLSRQITGEFLARQVIAFLLGVIGGYLACFLFIHIIKD